MNPELWVFGLIMVIGVAVAGRLQSRSYRKYLERHTDETRKITQNQARLIAQQDALVAAVNRVADALENRGA